MELSKHLPGILKSWANAIQLRNPSVMIDYYTNNAILVGTFSYPIEIGKKQIFKYFLDFLDKPGLKCKVTSNVNQQLNDLVISSGTYVFTYGNKEVQARYTFVFKNIGGQLRIVNHHSSELPEK